jgi:hypothetical protein
MSSAALDAGDQYRFRQFGVCRKCDMTIAIKAGAAYFLAVFAAGFVLGTLRVLVLVPRVGEAAAVMIELPLILVVAWIVCRWLVRRLSVPAAAGARLTMGGFAFALLLAAELALSFFVFGRSPAEHWQHYRSLAGALGLVGQIAFAAFPYLRLKLTLGKRRN